MEAEKKQAKIIFDPLYGFVHLTALEWEIIHTPYYQRLRWIKQIGFSCYTFPGAEHSRFGHSIGVMFNAHKILASIGKAVSDSQLFDANFASKEKTFHQSVRLAALLHDLGTFCFSHTTEMAYIRFGETTNSKNSKGHPDDHEHLGAWIIKNTNFKDGITYVLNKWGVDPQSISDLVKGTSSSILANQILHSEIDCDRMDYLLRDAHYTGLNYGTYDRDYLLHHFKTVEVAQKEVLVIGQNALHCVEDFLNARFAWYSQVVRSARGAKYDALAEELTFYLLEQGKIYSYSQLLEMATSDPVKFYGFNDHYFMGLIHRLYSEGFFDKNLRIKDICRCLLFEDSPRTVKDSAFKQRILDQNEPEKNEKIIKQAQEKVRELQAYVEKNGSSGDWIVDDVPTKSIVFMKSKKRIIKESKAVNIMHERDPVKILLDNGDPTLLVDVQQSVISQLQNCFNFVPNVFCSHSAYDLLKNSGLLEE